VTADLERMQFNTAIAALMEYLNVLAEGGVNRATRADLDTMIRLCAPFAPHLADEAWAHLGGQDRKPTFMLEQAWPAFDDKLTIDATVEIGVQVDGKVRGSVDISPTASEDEARTAALAVPNVAKHLEGRAIKKFIYKPGRIIGIVTAPG
jgi:leucyl-tRNA synthetase